jgi:hypothetical protein
MALTQLHKDDAIVVAHRGPFLLVIFFGDVGVRHIDRMQVLADELIAKLGRISLLIVALETPGGLKIPNDVRKRAVEVSAKLDPHLVGTGLALLLGGLSGVIARTFVSFVNRFAGNRSPQKTVGSVADGLSWLKTLSDRDRALVDDAGLLGEIEALVASVKLREGHLDRIS